MWKWAPEKEEPVHEFMKPNTAAKSAVFCP